MSTKRRVRVERERGIYRRGGTTGIYEFCFQDGSGKTRWGTARSLAEARALRGEKLAAVRRGERIPFGKTTVAEQAEEWLAWKAPTLRDQTREQYRRSLDLVIIPRFGRWKLAAVDADAIVRLVRDLERDGLHAVDPRHPKRPLGSSSIDSYLNPLQALLALAVRRGKLASSPFTVMTREDRPVREERRRPHRWSDDEMEALLSASEALARRSTSKYDYTPLLRILARLGLRLGEALGLKWSDIDKEAATLRVERQWLVRGSYGPPKTRAGERTIALPAEIVRELVALRLRSRYSGDEDPVFASLVGTPLTHRSVAQRGFERARDAAGLPAHLVLHDLRHAAVSRLIHAGLDPVTVAAVVGHEDATTTLRVYAAEWNAVETAEAVRKALSGGGRAL